MKLACETPRELFIARNMYPCSSRLSHRFRPRPPESPYTSPYTAPVPPPGMNHDASPGLAFILGLIPGVGAIYNGQYAKGLVHVVIVGLIISVLSNDAARGFEPLVGLMLGAFFFYMAFEAYHTARRRQHGLVVGRIFEPLSDARRRQ